MVATFSSSHLSKHLKGHSGPKNQQCHRVELFEPKIEKNKNLNVLKYLGAMLVDPVRRQNFAGKLAIRFYNI